MKQTHEQIRRLALNWVRQAGSIARQRYGSAITQRKADSSPVTDADHAVQAAILDVLARQYPEDAVLTEETLADPARHAELGSAQRVWVIDPIDGTRNYARTVPLYCISVALMENGTPVVGLIYDPMTGNFFSASTGGGAWLNETRLPATIDAPSVGLLVATPAGQHHHLPLAVHHWLENYNLRNLGTTALHVAYVATGGFDAALVTECHLWDIAAAWLIARETGAVTRRLDGGPLFPVDTGNLDSLELSFLIARPAVFEKLWAELQSPPAT